MYSQSVIVLLKGDKGKKGEKGTKGKKVVNVHVAVYCRHSESRIDFKNLCV